MQMEKHMNNQVLHVVNIMDKMSIERESEKDD